MWTEAVLEKVEGKTLTSTKVNYAGSDIYEIEMEFTDGTVIIIDTEHHPDHPLRVRFK